MCFFSLEANLIEVQFYVALFPNTAPSSFHNVHFSSLRNETDRKISPPPLHPQLCAHRGFKALLAQQWFEWLVYTVGLCLLVRTRSFWCLYWLSLLTVPRIKVHPLFKTPGLHTWAWASLCDQPSHFGSSLMNLLRLPRLALHSFTRSRCHPPALSLMQLQPARRFRSCSVWWVAIRCFKRDESQALFNCPWRGPFYGAPRKSQRLSVRHLWGWPIVTCRAECCVCLFKWVIITVFSLTLFASGEPEVHSWGSRCYQSPSNTAVHLFLS